MVASKYFDTRTLNQLARGGVRVCPVGSCKAAVQDHQPGKRIRFLCPDHGIEIRSKSFIYNNPLHNIRFERDYFNTAILKNKLKAETHRFGNENSEDALTWNVFAALARRNLLSALARSLFQLQTNEEPEMYLWGLRVDFNGPVPRNQFDALCAARNVFESDIARMHTEPDIMLYVPKRFLLLVEAKFGSGNTVAKLGASDVPDEKPKTPAGILQRYNAGQLPAGSLLTPSNEIPMFSQLYRNLVFAIHMAAQLDVQWGLVNLTSKRAYEEMSSDLTTNAVLPLASRQRFVRYTWERLFHDHVERKDGLDALATYLRFKSANCGRAFDI